VRVDPGTQRAGRGVGFDGHPVVLGARAKMDSTQVATVVLPLRVGWMVVTDHKPGPR
jgi:hypothetical protein